MPFRALLVLPLLTLAACAHHDERASEFSYAEPDAPPATQAAITRYADENRDGVVTRKEADADPALAAAFDRYDLDNDDELDRGEFARLEAERDRNVGSVPVRLEEEALPERRMRRSPGHSLNRTGVDELRPVEDAPERD